MSKTKKSIDELFNNGSEIDKALQSAVKEALLKHKAAGNPIGEQRGQVFLFDVTSTAGWARIMCS